MITECPRETDVFEAVAFGRWPEHCDQELKAHVSACAICADIVDVAGALHGDREWLCREAQPPAAGMVWWRATIRARAEAARTVSQPISVLQGIAGACIAGLVAGFATVLWQSIHWVDRLSDVALSLGIFSIPVCLFTKCRMLTGQAPPVIQTPIGVAYE